MLEETGHGEWKEAECDSAERGGAGRWMGLHHRVRPTDRDFQVVLRTWLSVDGFNGETGIPLVRGKITPAAASAEEGRPPG